MTSGLAALLKRAAELLTAFDWIFQRTRGGAKANGNLGLLFPMTAIFHGSWE
jgi:hypothetical protein